MAVEKEILKLRTSKYIDETCERHKPLFDRMISGEPIWIPHRCQPLPSKTATCSRCGIIFPTSTNLFQLYRHRNGKLIVNRRSCSCNKTRPDAPNQVSVREFYCSACVTHLIRNEMVQPLPFQTNPDWLRILTALFRHDFRDLVKIIADYDGYDPSTPPTPKCPHC